MVPCGTLTGMAGGEEDQDFVDAISGDVMDCLRACGFFEELDDRLCPVETGAPREQCDHSYRISESILASRGFAKDDFVDIRAVLQSKGGFCDCEILHNAADGSRLKAEHWRARAAEGRDGSSR